MAKSCAGGLFRPKRKKCGLNCQSKYVPEDPRAALCCDWCNAHESEIPPYGQFDQAITNVPSVTYEQYEDTANNSTQPPYVQQPNQQPDYTQQPFTPTPPVPANNTVIYLVAGLVLVGIAYFIYQKNKK